MSLRDVIKVPSTRLPAGEEVDDFEHISDIVLRTSWAICIAFKPNTTASEGGGHEEKVADDADATELGEEKEAGLYVWGGLNNTVTIVGIQSSAEECHGHSAYVAAVSVHPDGVTIASSSGDKSIMLWRDGNCLQTIKEHKQAVQGVAWSPLNGQLLSGSVDKTVKIWTGEPGSMTCAKTLTDHSAYFGVCPLEGARFILLGDDVNCVAWSPDGTRFASGGDDGLIAVSNPVVRLQVASAQSKILSLVWAPSAECVACGCYDGCVRVYNVETAANTLVLKHASPMVTAVVWNRHGLWSAGWDSRVNLWSPDGTKLNTFRTGSKVFSMAFSHDASEFGVTTQAGKLMVWRAKSTPADNGSEQRHAPDSILLRLAQHLGLNKFRKAFP